MPRGSQNGPKMEPKWTQEGLGGGLGSDPGKKGRILNPTIICYTSSTSAKPLGLHFWSLWASKSSQNASQKGILKNNRKKYFKNHKVNRNPLPVPGFMTKPGAIGPILSVGAALCAPAVLAKVCPSTMSQGGLNKSGSPEGCSAYITQTFQDAISTP